VLILAGWRVQTICRVFFSIVVNHHIHDISRGVAGDVAGGALPGDLYVGVWDAVVEGLEGKVETGINVVDLVGTMGGLGIAHIA